jgi:hypothetical protein
MILGLPCLLPLFECIHKLIKIAQGQDVFVCNLVEVVKLAQLELYRLYCHSFTKFEDATFDDFNAIENLTNATMPMQWFSNLNGGEDAKYLAFFFFRHKYPVYSSCIEVATTFQPITKVVFNMVMNKVKEECEGAA